MSLTNRWYHILNILFVKRHVTIEELSKITNLSKQTLKKNIALLNEQLKETAEISLYQRKFELIILDLTNFQMIMTGILKQETDFNSSGRRMAYILQKLIQEAEFILIDDLSELLQVSRGTVNNDLKTIKDAVASYGVSLEGVPNKGIRIIGDELNLRLILLEFVYDYYSFDYPLDKESNHWAEKLAQYYKLDQSMKNIFKKVIAISLTRILSNHSLLEEIPFYSNFEYETEMMEGFMFFLERNNQLTLSKYDQDFISFPINTRTGATDFNNHMKDHEQVVRAIYDEMLMEIKANFMVNLNEHDLFELLKHHLTFMLNRLIFHIDIFDIFVDEIQIKYPFAYEIAKFGISFLAEKLKIPVNEKEIEYLAIYFELVLNKERTYGEAKKVAIICTTGRGTTALIKRQLREVLGQDISIEQHSELAYQELDLSQYLAVFSTLPLPPKDGKSIIQITSLFDNKALIQEWKKIDEQLLIDDNLLDITFQVLDAKENYSTNVTKMINELTNLGKLDSKFLTNWQERERKQTTIFDHGIGFPHTINYKSEKIILRVGVFKEKIREGGREVQIVFLVGIPDTHSEHLDEAILKIYDLIFYLGQSQTLLDEIRQFTNSAELRLFLERKELI